MLINTKKHKAGIQNNIFTVILLWNSYINKMMDVKKIYFLFKENV